MQHLETGKLVQILLEFNQSPEVFTDSLFASRVDEFSALFTFTQGKALQVRKARQSNPSFMLAIIDLFS